MSRQAEMIDMLLEQGFLTVSQLADKFAVTESTVRRDLTELQARDLVQRTRGGALPVETTVEVSN